MRNGGTEGLDEEENDRESSLCANEGIEQVAKVVRTYVVGSRARRSAGRLVNSPPLRPACVGGGLGSVRTDRIASSICIFIASSMCIFLFRPCAQHLLLFLNHVNTIHQATNRFRAFFFFSFPSDTFPSQVETLIVNCQRSSRYPDRVSSSMTRCLFCT
jgi:hypothetical protein